MQIRHATAQGMGYSGACLGLLDADTNLTYGVPYLANAYHIAGGDHDRAMALYKTGYYYEAKRKGLLDTLVKAKPSGTIAAFEESAKARSEFARTISEALSPAVVSVAQSAVVKTLPEVAQALGVLERRGDRRISEYFLRMQRAPSMRPRQSRLGWPTRPSSPIA